MVFWKETLVIVTFILLIGCLLFLSGAFLILSNNDKVTKNQCDKTGILYLENVEYACVRVPE